MTKEYRVAFLPAAAVASAGRSTTGACLVLRSAQAGLYPGHRGGLPVGDVGTGPPGPGEAGRVAQFDERVIPVEVTECFRIYGAADGTVQAFGGGKQFPGLEHAVAVADPPSVRSAGQPLPFDQPG